MAGAVPVLDEIIKEYLLFRGFTSSLKSFETDLKGDKDKSFKVTRIIDQLFTFISTYDVLGLKYYWEHLNRRFFQRLDYQHYANVKKLETCLLRLYIVHALQNSKHDKVVEFFEKCASELQQKSEWREWFAIPFIKNPEQNVSFEMYFSRSWQETFMLSLHNFLITIFHHMPMPTLIKLDEERGKLQRLERENEKLKEQVVSLADETAQLQREKSKLAEIIRENEKMEKGDAVDDEDADEFCVVSSKPIKIIQQMKDTFKGRIPGRSGKSKEEKRGNKAGLTKQPSEDENHTKQKRQQILKQLQQLQELQDEQKTLEMLEDEQSNKSTDLPEKSPRNQQDTESHPPDQLETIEHVTEGHGALRKARSFDSCPPCNLDEVDNPESSRRNTVPAKDLKKPSALSRGKNAEETLSRTVHFFEEETKNKAFLRLGQEEYKEHHSAVIHCRFSFSGRMIASADADGIVKVWTNHPEIKTCATIMSKSPLLSLEWAAKPDRLLLMGTGNCKVRFYDTDNKKTICDVLTEPQYPRVVSISCSPTGKAFVCSAATAPKVSSHRALSSSTSLVSELANVTGSSSGAGVLQYWDIKTQKMERQLALDPAPTCVNCTTFNHNGTLLVSGASDGMIRLFDMRTYDCLNAWHAHHGDVCSVQFSVDETTIYSMGADGKFCQWSVHRMGQKMADLNIHDGAVWCGADGARTKSKSSTAPVTYGRLFAFDSEGQYVLTCGSLCGIIYRVDKDKTLTQVMNLQDHRSAVVSVDWTSSLSYCTSLTGSLDGAIQVASLLKQ